jgi:hypothetical protein
LLRAGHGCDVGGESTANKHRQLDVPGGGGGLKAGGRIKWRIGHLWHPQVSPYLPPSCQLSASLNSKNEAAQQMLSKAC